jgi:glycosyltransferase involved in cell wall biosynthesis
VVNEAMAAGLPVIVSSRAGAAADLVRHGVNGFTFDPDDSDSLVDHMSRLSDSSSLVANMGEMSKNIIDEWGLGRFSSGLAEACSLATSRKSKRPKLIDRLLLKAALLKAKA